MKKLFTLVFFILLCNAGFSQSWKSLAAVNGNYTRTGSFSINGKGYVFGAHYNNQVSSYDTLSNIWTTMNNYPANTTDGVVACSLNGFGYAGTGVEGSSFTNNFFKYDPGADSWTPLTNFPGTARAYAVMFALDGKIYIGGGLSSGVVSNTDFYAYDPVAGTWGPAIVPCPALGVACDAVAFVVGDNAYVGTGGKINSLNQSVPQKDFYEYDTISKTWTRVADLPGQTRAEGSAFSTCDKGYVGLGYTDSTRNTDAADFWQYNPVKDTWTPIADFAGGARNGACAFTIGKTGYVCGGSPPGGSDFHDTWSFTETVTPAFTVASVSSRTICAGQSVTFNDTSNYSPTNWQWSFQGGTPNTSTQENPTIRYDSAGTYDVTMSAWNGCDSAAVTFSQYIIVDSGGVLTVTANPASICSGQSSTLTVVGGSGTYQWLPATGLTDSTSSFISVHPDTTTTYNVVQAASGGCAYTGSVTLEVGNNTIGGHVTAIRDTICYGTSGNLSLSGNSSNTLQWQSSTDDISFTNAAHDTLPGYKTTPLSQSTWYRVIVGSGNCSAISDTLGLYVPPVLTASFYSVAGTSNQLIFNSDSSIGNIRSYHWDFGDGSTSTDSNPSHTYAKDSTYYVCLTLYDGSNCSYTFCRYSSVTDGVPTISAAGNWVIYPNPFSEQLTVSSKQRNNEAQSIEMYDVLGQLVINKSLNNATNTSLQLDVSSLAKGMYYVMIRTADADYVQKAVKQ